MFPVLFSIGNISVSSFGVFLALGFLLTLLLVWRLARAWDLDEEKILDLTLLTFVGGLIGARVYFALEHWQFFFTSPLKLILIMKYPGFSFWGGFLGGWLTLHFLARRMKMDFWQAADIASVGLIGGLVLSDLGCFFGGCSVGVVSKAFFAVPMVGLIGKRWPVQLVEALLLVIILVKIWSQATHFHQRGKIVSLVLIALSLIKLVLEPFKQENSYFFDLILLSLGLTIFYKVTRRNILRDLKSGFGFAIGVFTKESNRKLLYQYFSKSWYNHKTSFLWNVRNFKKILRRLNVRFSYKNH